MNGTSTPDGRIRELEQELVTIEQQLMALHQGRDPNQLPPPPGGSAGQAPPPPPAFSPPPPATSNNPFASVELLLRVGGIGFVVLAVAFFVSTAISRGWIGPGMQLAMATTTALAIIAQSFRFSMERRAWRVTFALGGATALFAAGAIGYDGLELLSLSQASAWFTVAILGFLGLARLHHSEPVGLASLPALGAGILLLDLFGYGDIGLLALVGALYAAAIAFSTWATDWRLLRSLGLTVAALLALLGQYEALAAGAAAHFVIPAFVIGVVSIGAVAIKQALDTRDDLSMEALVEARVAAASIPWLAAVTAPVVQGFANNVDTGAIIGLTGLTAGLAVAMNGHRVSPLMSGLHQVAAIATMAVGAVMVLDGPALLIALAMQAFLGLYLATKTRSVEMLVIGALLGTVASWWTLLLLLCGSLDEALSTGEVVATGIVVMGGALFGWFLRTEHKVNEGWVVGWLGLLGWFATARLIIPQGDMATSLLWAGLGTIMVIVGARLADRGIVWSGLATLAATATKLMIIDLASVDVLWRAGLFFAVGAVFLRLGFKIPEMLGTARE